MEEEVSLGPPGGAGRGGGAAGENMLPWGHGLE